MIDPLSIGVEALSEVLRPVFVFLAIVISAWFVIDVILILLAADGKKKVGSGFWINVFMWLILVIFFWFMVIATEFFVGKLILKI